MAKWGEGDPRWIVQEREDGHNLNDWHWVEKSIIPWAKKELQTRIKGLSIYNGPLGSFAFVDMKNLDGTICAHVRRGKRFVLYDYNVSFTFSGHLASSEGKELKGDIKIPYLGDENDFDDFEFEVIVEDGSSSEKAAAKKIIFQECKTVLRKAIKEFMTHMTDVWTKGPLRSDSQTEVKRMDLKSEVRESQKDSSLYHISNDGGKENDSALKTIVQSVTLNGPTMMIFQTFLDKDRLSAFTQSESNMDPRVGGAFSLFSGNVTGQFLEIVGEKKIVQRWRFNDWKDGVYSTVSLTFTNEGSKTKIDLHHSGIPQQDLERTKEGWNRFYWNNFRNIFGGNIGNFI